MDYSGTVGAKTGRLLPTGNPVDRVELEDGRGVNVTVCDAANPCVFVAAADLGLSGSELPPAISAHRALIETLGEIQAKVGQRIGSWSDWRARPPPAPPPPPLPAPPGGPHRLE